MKRHDGDVASHRAEYHLGLVVAKEMFLHPIEKIAATSDAKDINQHEHCPKTEATGHNQVFWASEHQVFHPRFAEVVDDSSIDVHHRRRNTIHIRGSRAHHSVRQFGMCAKSLGVIQEEKLHPPSPEEQSSDETENRLTSVALTAKNTAHCQQETHKAHAKRRRSEVG